MEWIKIAKFYKSIILHMENYKGRYQDHVESLII